MDDDKVFAPGINASMIRALASQMVADGIIDPTGMSQDDFRGAFMSEVKAIQVADAPDFGFILDHQDSVLGQARAYGKSEDVDFAMMFYATWNEHWLNQMLVWKAKRMGKPQEEAAQLVHVDLKKKTGQLWTTTFGVVLDAGLAGAIREIAGFRNAFVHYKWQSKREGDIEAEEVKKREVLARAEPLVVQLEALRKAMIFGDSHSWIQAL